MCWEKTRVNQACFDFFEPVRFSADVDDPFDASISSPQQTEGLLSAGFPSHPRSILILQSTNFLLLWH